MSVNLLLCYFPARIQGADDKTLLLIIVIEDLQNQEVRHLSDPRIQAYREMIPAFAAADCCAWFCTYPVRESTQPTTAIARPEFSFCEKLVIAEPMPSILRFVLYSP